MKSFKIDAKGSADFMRQLKELVDAEKQKRNECNGVSSKSKETK